MVKQLLSCHIETGNMTYTLWMQMEAAKEGSRKISGTLIMRPLGRLMEGILRIVSSIRGKATKEIQTLRFLL